MTVNSTDELKQSNIESGGGSSGSNSTTIRNSLILLTLVLVLIVYPVKKRWNRAIQGNFLKRKIKEWCAGGGI